MRKVKKYWLKDTVNTKLAADRIPGDIMGKVTYMKFWIGLAPNTFLHLELVPHRFKYIFQYPDAVRGYRESNGPAPLQRRY